MSQLKKRPQKSPIINNTAHVWQVLFNAVERSPADAKQSILQMRSIGLLDDTACEFMLAALRLGVE